MSRSSGRRNNGVGFVILDTVHILPGEVLDFLTILPHLKDNAIVLIIRWSYIPEGKGLIGYTNAILKNYSQDLFLIFQEAVRLNFRSINIEAQMRSQQ